VPLKSEKMTQNIAFSDAEISELRNFYINELNLAEDRVKNIRAILSKIGNSPVKKRGRKPKAASVGSDTQNTAVQVAPKRRGRPKKNEGIAAAVSSKSTGKRRGRPSTKNSVSAEVPAKTSKRRGPRIKKSLANIENLIHADNNSVALPAKKRGRKPGVKNNTSTGLNSNNLPAIPKKRGRKPGSGKKAVAADVSNIAAVVKKQRGRKPGSGKKAAVEGSNTLVVIKKTRGRKPGSNPKSTSLSTDNAAVPAKKTRGRKKNNVAESANLKAEAAVKSAKAPKAKTTAKKESKPKMVKPAVVSKAKKVTAAAAPKPERQTKKKMMHEFINEILSSAPRFYTTDELVQRGIKKFNLKGKEKDTAKNSIQLALNSLQSESKIKRRRKEKDRQAYWALPSISDEGYIA